MFGFVRGRAVVVVLVVAGLLGGVTASSVAAATKTTVTWKVSSLTAGQRMSLSAIATSNSKGVKTWSKTGSCVLSPKSKPPKLTMGTGVQCTLTLKIARSGKYPAKTSTKIITRKSSPTTTTTTLALSCASGGSCVAGDTGPGGGIIFYVDMTRAVGSQYFEAACIGWSDGTCGGFDYVDPKAEWGCRGSLIMGADGTAIGTGEQNTVDIMRDCSALGIAARLAGALELGGQDDWFLPSKDELDQMYEERNEIGGLFSEVYWSSFESSDYNSWYQGLGDGGQYDDSKSYPHYVRPIRAF